MPAITISDLLLSSVPQARRKLWDSEKILLKIFLFAVNEHYADTTAACEEKLKGCATDRKGIAKAVSHQGTAFSIASTCVYWGELCLNDPSLWDRLVVPLIGDLPASNQGDIVKATRAHIRNSRTRPMSLSLYFIDGQDVAAAASTATSAVWAMIGTCSERLQTLAITHVSDRDNLLPFTFPRNTPPSLAELSLRGRSISLLNSIHRPTWPTSARLVIDVTVGEPNPLLHPLLSIVQSLTVHVQDSTRDRRHIVSLESLENILQPITNMQHLRELVIHVPDSWGSKAKWKGIHEKSGTLRFCLPQLKILRLKGFSSRGTMYYSLLNRSRFPSLTVLDIDEPMPYRLPRAIRNWECNLESIAITVRPDECPFFTIPEPLILHAQSITSLTIRAHDDARSPEIAFQLASDPNVFPRLAHVNLEVYHYDANRRQRRHSHGCATEGFDWASAILYMIKRRRSIETFKGTLSYSTDRIPELDKAFRETASRYWIKIYAGTTHYAIIQKEEGPIVWKRNRL